MCGVEEAVLGRGKKEEEEEGSEGEKKMRTTFALCKRCISVPDQCCSA